MQKMHIASSIKPVAYYNLDVIIEAVKETMMTASNDSCQIADCYAD